MLSLLYWYLVLQMSWIGESRAKQIVFGETECIAHDPDAKPVPLSLFQYSSNTPIDNCPNFLHNMAYEQSNERALPSILYQRYMYCGRRNFQALIYLTVPMGILLFSPLHVFTK